MMRSHHPSGATLVGRQVARSTRSAQAEQARRPRWAAAVALATSGRPARFALTGGVAGLSQLALLALFTGRGWVPGTANVVAFLLAAQLNFLLSSTFTWRDRASGAGRGRDHWRRWLAYHGAIGGMAALNMLVYSMARHVAPVLAASALGIVAAAVGNFVVGDRLVFRARGGLAAPPQEPEQRTSEPRPAPAQRVQRAEPRLAARSCGAPRLWSRAWARHSSTLPPPRGPPPAVTPLHPPQEVAALPRISSRPDHVYPCVTCYPPQRRGRPHSARLDRMGASTAGRDRENPAGAGGVGL